MHVAPSDQRLTDETWPPPGELVGGRYRVIEHLGSGGMGRVVSARDEQTGNEVAIKLLVAPAWRAVLVERFFREARTVSRIDSPHVVKIIAVSAVNEATPYMVMERLRGRDYSRRVQRDGALPVREVADCVIQACKALASSHAMGVIHRDVKPSNLFEHVDASGNRTVKVLDFGISKARGAQECEWTLTTTRDTMLGSPPYMSPEHLRDARIVDHRTDIWSLGVVLYQLLAGRLPFNGSSVGALLCAVLERRFTPLSEMQPNVPQEVCAIVDRCLASDPKDRFQTAAELAKALAPFASPHMAREAMTVETKVALSIMTAMTPAHPMRPLNAATAATRLDGEPRTMTVAPANVAVVPVAPVALAPAPVETTLPSLLVPASGSLLERPVAPVMDQSNAIEAHAEFDDDAASRAITTLMDARPSYSSLPGVTSSATFHVPFKKPSRTVMAAAAAALVALLALPFAFSGSPGVAPASSNAPPAMVEPVATPAPTPAPAPAPTAETITLDDEITFETAKAPATGTVANAKSAKPRTAGSAPSAKRGGLPRAVDRALDSRR